MMSDRSKRAGFGWRAPVLNPAPRRREGDAPAGVHLRPEEPRLSAYGARQQGRKIVEALPWALCNARESLERGCDRQEQPPRFVWDKSRSVRFVKRDRAVVPSVDDEGEGPDTEAVCADRGVRYERAAKTAPRTFRRNSQTADQDGRDDRIARQPLGDGRRQGVEGNMLRGKRIIPAISPSGATATKQPATRRFTSCRASSRR